MGIRDFLVAIFVHTQVILLKNMLQTRILLTYIRAFSNDYWVSRCINS